MRRSATWGLGLGITAGFVAWIVDQDLFLNAGGPAAPVSTAILRGTGLSQAPAAVFIFAPPLVLMAVGGVVGFVLGRAATRRR